MKSNLLWRKRAAAIATTFGFLFPALAQAQSLPVDDIVEIACGLYGLVAEVLVIHHIPA